MSQATTATKNPLDLFVTGAKHGWNMGVNNLIPNIVMAFVIIEILKITGILGLIGKVAGPVMALWGLPGEALVILCTGILSQGGAVGMIVSLHTAGTMTLADVAVITPGMMMIGGLVQYVGRCLGTANANRKYWGWHIAIALFNSAIAMWVARALITALYGSPS